MSFTCAMRTVIAPCGPAWPTAVPASPCARRRRRSEVNCATYTALPEPWPEPADGPAPDAEEETARAALRALAVAA